MPSDLSVFVALSPSENPWFWFAAGYSFVVLFFGVPIYRQYKRRMGPRTDLASVSVLVLAFLLLGGAVGSGFSMMVASERLNQAEQQIGQIGMDVFLAGWSGTPVWLKKGGDGGEALEPDDPERIPSSLLSRACLRAAEIVLAAPPADWTAADQVRVEENFKAMSEKPEFFAQRRLKRKHAPRPKNNGVRDGRKVDRYVPVAQADQLSGPARICVYVDRIAKHYPSNAEGASEEGLVEFLSLVILHETGHICRARWGLLEFEETIPGDEVDRDILLHARFGFWIQLLGRAAAAEAPSSPRSHGACAFHRMTAEALSRGGSGAGNVLDGLNGFNSSGGTNLVPGPYEWGTLGFDTRCRVCGGR